MIPVSCVDPDGLENDGIIIIIIIIIIITQSFIIYVPSQQLKPITDTGQCR
jgi:hypothetical protein